MGTGRREDALAPPETPPMQPGPAPHGSRGSGLAPPRAGHRLGRARHRPSLSFLICRTGRLPATARHGEPGVQAQGSLAATGGQPPSGRPPPGQQAAAGVGDDTPTG